MGKKPVLFFSVLLTAALCIEPAIAQEYKITLVNMIPAVLETEISSDAEPSIAVNPANPKIIAASAFTQSMNRFSNGIALCDSFPCRNGIDTLTSQHENLPNCKAPLFFSADGGTSWELRDALPSNNGLTHDITLSFSEAGFLYAAFLKGCAYGPINVPGQFNNMKGLTVMRSASALNNEQLVKRETNFVELQNWWGIQYDMPWVVAKTDGSGKEHVYIGVNHFANARSRSHSEGQTATVMVSNNAGVHQFPVPFRSILIDTVKQRDKNPAGIRLATHPSGRIYAIYYRASRLFPLRVRVENCDVVLVRDDHFALGETPFTELEENNTLGILIAKDRDVPAHFMDSTRGFVGKNRLTGSDLAVAVNPGNADQVFVAWGAEEEGVYSLHFNYNSNGGKGKWLSLAPGLDKLSQAVNPAIAITGDGQVGILYQQFVKGWWETHFVVGQVNKKNFKLTNNWVLSRFHADEIPTTYGRRSISGFGDYFDLQAVGNIFYGVFSAVNIPDPAGNDVSPASRFPTTRPLYQRNENLLMGKVPAVRHSIDPFFFKVERE